MGTLRSIVHFYHLFRALACTLRRNVTLFHACSCCSSIYMTLPRQKISRWMNMYHGNTTTIPKKHHIHNIADNIWYKPINLIKSTSVHISQSTSHLCGAMLEPDTLQAISLSPLVLLITWIFSCHSSHLEGD